MYVVSGANFANVNNNGNANHNNASNVNGVRPDSLPAHFGLSSRVQVKGRKECPFRYLKRRINTQPPKAELRLGFLLHNGAGGFLFWCKKETLYGIHGR